VDDSSKRILLTVVLCTGILFGWYYLFPKKSVKPPAPAPAAGSGATAGSGEQTGSATAAGSGKQAGSGEAQRPAPASAPAESQPTSAAVKRQAEGGPLAGSAAGRQATFKTDDAVIKFTTRGAALRSIRLTEPRYTEKRAGRQIPVDLVQINKSGGPWPLTTTFTKSDFELPADAAFSVTNKTDREVTYRWRSNKVEVNKRFVVHRDRPVIDMTLRVKNLGMQKLRHKLVVDLFNDQQPGQAKAGFTNPYPKIPTVMCYLNGKIQRRSASSIRGEGSSCSAAGCGMGKGPLVKGSESSNFGEVLWVGAGDRYFMTALVPQDPQKPDESRSCELKLFNEKGDNITQASLVYPEGRLEAGKEQTWSFKVFTGPKKLAALDRVKGPDHGEVHLSDSVEYGWFAFLCRPMLWLMQQFYRFVGNWGIAIIMLTLVVKLLTLYWTQKSMRSMNQMKKLKPRIDELREKYKDDKQRLNQEQMNLYKAYKVNPLGGCLPMLIQMPIWFALYRTLGNAVELYHSEFFGWITDLTAPDPYYVTPILMGLAMYGQQAITPQPMEGTQAKMMKYFMPGVFTVMMLALPSGLTLYIFVNTILTMLHQFYMNKTDPDKKLEKDVAQAVDSAAGKSPRPAARRPAKPAAASPGKTGAAAPAKKTDRKTRPRRRRRKKK
jgi:YidC/Oxa1 family membrane protein insertase